MARRRETPMVASNTTVPGANKSNETSNTKKQPGTSHTSSSTSDANLPGVNKPTGSSNTKKQPEVSNATATPSAINLPCRAAGADDDNSSPASQAACLARMTQFDDRMELEEHLTICPGARAIYEQHKEQVEVAVLRNITGLKHNTGDNDIDEALRYAIVFCRAGRIEHSRHGWMDFITELGSELLLNTGRGPLDVYRRAIAAAAFNTRNHHARASHRLMYTGTVLPSRENQKHPHTHTVRGEDAFWEHVLMTVSRTKDDGA
ncbi:hypothetical protein GGR56DRAFT_614603 [Xylariaceae sp. FL0804]|nr:hypothetical protein GGR56DRAFT_614603 [Xylariaceae sp. FL0804]